MGPDSVRTLRVWQEGMTLVKDSYALTANWPKSELFGLTGQIRRAATSIPCNLAEGKGRGSAAELVRFARIALGSAYELDTLLEIATELQFADQSKVTVLRERLASLVRQLSTYIQSRRA
ncbi:MAG TPA: four helix bundle protein [Bryobacteraceae bacterium]|nr:four helix bundle protein [Bryobacteraceae bacterium]